MSAAVPAGVVWILRKVGRRGGATGALTLFADFFAPRYRRLFDAMHAAGYDVWLHSCGQVNELICRPNFTGLVLVRSWNRAGRRRAVQGPGPAVDGRPRF